MSGIVKAKIVKIGNSKGVLIPSAILQQCGFDKKVEIEVRHNNIILKPVKSPREGWAAAFKKMHQNGDDAILIPDELDVELLEEIDEN